MTDGRDFLTWTPKMATEAACRFYKQNHRDIQHAASASMLLANYESLLEGVGGAFASIAPNGPEELFPNLYQQRERMKQMVDRLTPASAELGLTRSVESFLAYMSDVLTATLIQRPELLKTQEQVTLEDVLDHGTIEDFVSWAAEKRVNQLSFKGLDDIAQYIKKRLCLELHQDESDWVNLKKGVAIRNLIVHRRSVIDQRFIRLAKEEEYVKGDEYQASMKDYVRTARSAMKIVGEFDAKVAAKFSLTQRSTEDEDWYSLGRWGPEGRPNRAKSADTTSDA